MSGARKACPVVVRRTADRLEILAFRHPTAGCQLVKGTIEPDETIEHAAERELLEESGIPGAAIRSLGSVQMADPEQEWHFVVCRVGPLPETWIHRTGDGGGLDFEFFWHPLRSDPDRSWHPSFRRALGFVRRRQTIMDR